MEMGLLYIGYIVATTLALLVSLRLLGIRNTGLSGIGIGVINGTIDYVIREILTPGNSSITGFHIIISVIVVSILCYWWLRLNILGAIIIPCFAYILAALGEIMMLIFIISLLDKSLIEVAFKNIDLQIKLGIFTQIPLIIVFLLLKLKYKNFTIYKLEKFIRKKGK